MRNQPFLCAYMRIIADYMRLYPHMRTFFERIYWTVHPGLTEKVVIGGGAYLKEQGRRGEQIVFGLIPKQPSAPKGVLEEKINSFLGNYNRLTDMPGHREV